MTTAIAIRNLRKTYSDGPRRQEKEALKGVDLDIPAGSFFGLLGPNGAGKSTLINIMSGLVNKTSGTVSIQGHDIDTQLRQARRAIGVVPQELVLDTFFTVRQALEIHAGYYAVPKAQRRTQEIIDAMGLTDKADIHARRLSGGMRRRLLIAKALVHNPPVLVLDEPTAGVDVELRTQLWDYVRKLNERGTTVLLTTHYLEEAQELCDHIAIINYGKVIARDSKYNLMRQLDRKQVTIKTEHVLTSLPPSLAAMGATLTSDGQLCIGYQPSHANIQKVLDDVRAAGLTVFDLATSEPDLEDVFRHLTRAEAA